MALTLKNYTTILPADLLAQAGKNKVRECDETEKGQFVAYVDDGSDSFDVSVTLRAGNEITGHTCDCSSKAKICRHKAALIIHIAEGKKPKEVVKVKKKESKAGSLLDDVDPNKLKEWVKSLIEKNKDIELSFVNYFSAKKQLTTAEVASMIIDSVKAVAGNKKAIDLTQLKKIVGLWAEMLEPVAEDYRSNVTDEKAFFNFHTMLETCLSFQFRVASASNKISKFIDDNLLNTVEALNNLQVEEAWDKAIGYFVTHVPDGQYNVRLYYLVHLRNIAGISSEERKAKLVDRLNRQFEKSKPDSMHVGAMYSKFIFIITTENNLFPKYYTLFKPIRYDNDYNEKLIALLIAENHLELAKKYCDEQIMYNSRQEFNLLYLKFLKEIHLLEKDDAALTKLLPVLVPFTFDFDDYIFVSERLPAGEERKKWLTKMLARAKSASSPYKKAAAEFYFKLAVFEKTYGRMIGFIDSETPLKLIIEHFGEMALTDKNKLMEAMLRRRNDYGWGVAHEIKAQEALHFPELYKLFEKHYQMDYLKMVIANADKDRWYKFNDFMAYMKQQLGI